MNNVIKRYDDLMVEKNLLVKQYNDDVDNSDNIESQKEDLIKARWVVAEVAKETQQIFSDNVEKLISSAIMAVFPDRNFKFKLKFDIKANKSVCMPVIEENGEEFIPKDDMGGSIIDVISFAFRIVLWKFENPQSRNVFILDEPMKWLGKNTQMSLAGKMLKEVSSKLNIQLIIVTHEPKLAEIADKAWEVTYKNKRSTVEVLK